MRSPTILILAFFAFLALSNAFEGEEIGMYTRFYQKEAGADKATNSVLTNDWEACKPEDSACVTKLPSDLTADNVKAECHTNSGAKNVYNFSGSDFFTLLNTGAAPQTNMENWLDELCGKTVNSKDFVTIFIYDITRESNDWANETANIFQSYIRLWYLYDGSDPISSSLKIDANKPSVVMEYTVRYPPQGAGVSFRPQFLPTSGNEAKANSWTNLTKAEYCELPSSFSATDNLVGTSFKFELELGYEEYQQLAEVTQSGVLEISEFDIQLFAYDCTPTVPRKTVQKLYITTGNVVYNRDVAADSRLGTTMRVSTLEERNGYLQLASTLKFCETADCSNPINGIANFVVNQDAYAILTIPSSSRKFVTQDMHLEDGEGNRITGGITVGIEDESQTGKVIYKVTFSRVYSFAILTIKANANPARRLLEDDPNSSTKGHTAQDTMTINVTDTGLPNGNGNDDGDGNGNNDGTSASTMTVFAAFFASVCYLFQQS